MEHGDATADWLGQLLADHGAALVLYARQLCRTPEDVVQQALIELVSQAQRPENAVAWLYRMVRNRAISTSRSDRRRIAREAQAAAPEAWFDSAASRLDADEAAQALAGLPLELREVVVARIWGQLKFADIAELVGTSLSTTQRRYEQAIRELQMRLEKPCTTDTRRPERT